MATDYPKININQLELDALSGYLVKANNLVYKENSSGNTADDVDKVAGVDSNLVAVAYDAADRSTVLNSRQLGGIDADKYMTTETAAGLSAEQARLKEVQADEISDLKDELYQLKAELLKKGVIDFSGTYAGYTDPFRRNKYINEHEVLGSASRVGALEKELFIDDVGVYESLDVYDFVCIVNEASDAIKNYEILEIIEKNDARRSIVFDEMDKGIIYGDSLKLYKSMGINHNGLFKFAAVDKTLGVPCYNGLTDDDYIKTKRVQKNNEGFGFSFRVPTEDQGYVIGFKIGAKATGTPGQVFCYLIDSRDADRFLNPVQFEEDYKKDSKKEAADGIKFFAKSKPLTWTSSEGKRYKEFDFLQEDGSYPKMSCDEDDEKTRYIAIIECTYADTSNYLDFIFLQHKSAAGEMGDLELNNRAYYYARQEADSSDKALTTDEEMSKFDMYHQIVTCPELEGIIPYDQGLYTGRCYCQNVKYPATKARLMLRVSREGMFAVDINEKGQVVTDSVPVACEGKNSYINSTTYLYIDNDTVKRKELQESSSDKKEKVTAVIGNNICKAVAGTNSINIQDGYVAVTDNDKVYRMNYLVSVKARRVEVDKTTGAGEVSLYDHYVLPLVAVHKDIDTDRNFSDRLIFECDVTKSDENGFLVPYNEFEFQIFWENRNMAENDSVGRNIRAEQMGCIKDLVFSLDRGF